jgi:hypothetical protein
VQVDRLNLIEQLMTGRKPTSASTGAGAGGSGSGSGGAASVTDSTGRSVYEKGLFSAHNVKGRRSLAQVAMTPLTTAVTSSRKPAQEELVWAFHRTGFGDQIIPPDASKDRTAPLCSVPSPNAKAARNAHSFSSSLFPCSRSDAIACGGPRPCDDC